jgi:hypothetical protein
VARELLGAPEQQTAEGMAVLRGRLYLATKGEQGGDHKSEESKGHSGTLIDAADVVAEQCGVSPRTVKRDAAFAVALDSVAEALGEMLAEMPDDQRGRPPKNGHEQGPFSPTLADLGIKKNQSSRCQRLAAVREDLGILQPAGASLRARARLGGSGGAGCRVCRLLHRVAPGGSGAAGGVARELTLLT